MDHHPDKSVLQLVHQVQEMVNRSGNPEGFDARLWIEKWIESPVPALDGRRPKEYLATAEGCTLVAKVLACAESGAYL